MASADLEAFTAAKKRATAAHSQLEHTLRGARGRRDHGKEERRNLESLRQAAETLKAEIKQLTPPAAKPESIAQEKLIIAAIPGGAVGNAHVAFAMAEGRLIGLLRGLGRRDRVVFLQRVRRGDPADPLASRWRRMTAARRSRILWALGGSRPAPARPRVAKPAKEPVEQRAPARAQPKNTHSSVKQTPTKSADEAPIVGADVSISRGALTKAARESMQVVRTTLVPAYRNAVDSLEPGAVIHLARSCVKGFHLSTELVRRVGDAPTTSKAEASFDMEHEDFKAELLELGKHLVLNMSPQMFRGRSVTGRTDVIAPHKNVAAAILREASIGTPIEVLDIRPVGPRPAAGYQRRGSFKGTHSLERTVRRLEPAIGGSASTAGSKSGEPAEDKR